MISDEIHMCKAEECAVDTWRTGEEWACQEKRHMGARKAATIQDSGEDQPADVYVSHRQR